MTTEINLGNLVIPIIKPEKGKDYYTETEKQELISIVTDNVNSVVLPQEQTRQENEATRQSNEETRQSQENTRQSNEVSRQTAESARVEAENLRQSNESSRISAEQARVGTFNTQMQAVDTAIAGIHTSQDAYDQNAQNKTEAFNTNATNKMNAYNENASEKIAEYDQHVHDYETELANKVDKVQGKGLSTNDYDNTEKGKVQTNTEARHTHSNKSVLDGTTASYTTEKDQKLDGLENYDDTELREDIEQNTTNIEELKQENEDLKKNQLTNTPTPATSHYLQDSADSRFRKFIPIARTTQESTTGKQLFNKLIKTPKSNGAKYSTDSLSVEVDFTNSSDEYFSILMIESPTTKTYTLAFEASGVKNGENPRYSLWDGGSNFILKNGRNVVVIPNGTEIKNNKILLDDQSKSIYPNTSKVTFTNFMLVEGEYTEETMPDYEPYTGGEPAPNPNYPYAIKNTGDNGSVNEEIQNANIWDEEWEVGGINNSNGENYVSTSLIRSKNYIPVNPNTQLYIKNGTDYAWFYAYDKDKNFIGYAFGSSSSVANEIKTTIANCYYVRFQCRSQYGTTYNNDICINVSNPSINGTYVPHSEQNISFPLAEGQKLMEGDYPDDDEKVHHKRIEIVLDGTETINKETNSSAPLGFYFKLYLPLKAKYIDTTSAKDTMLSSHFKVVDNNVRQWGSGCLTLSSTGLYIVFVITSAEDTVEKVSDWLSINLPKFQYELAEEQTEDFTEEQKTAWPEWKKARTYKNVTHISSEDETPANVELEYVQDTKTYIDNKVTALTNAIISLGGNI